MKKHLSLLLFLVWAMPCVRLLAQSDANKFVAQSVVNGSVSDDGKRVMMVTASDQVRNRWLKSTGTEEYKFFDLQTGRFIGADTNYLDVDNVRYMRKNVNTGPATTINTRKKLTLDSLRIAFIVKYNTLNPWPQWVGDLSNGHSVYSYFIISPSAVQHDNVDKDAQLLFAEYDNENNTVTAIKSIKYSPNPPYTDQYTNRSYYFGTHPYLMPDGNSLFIYGELWSYKSGKRIRKNNGVDRLCSGACVRFSATGDTMVVAETRNNGYNCIRFIDWKEVKEWPNTGKVAYTPTTYEQSCLLPDHSMTLLDCTPDYNYLLFSDGNKAVLKHIATGDLTWLGDDEIDPVAMKRFVREYIAAGEREKAEKQAAWERECDRRKKEWSEWSAKHTLDASSFGPSAQEAARQGEWERAHPLPQQPASTTTVSHPSLYIKKDNTEQQRMDQMNREAAAREKAYNDKWGRLQH